MSDGDIGPFWLGPNWHYEGSVGADGMRLWRVIREDAQGSVPVGSIRELPPRTSRESSRFVAESLEGKRLGPERATGPSHSLSDIKRHLGDA